LRLPFSSVYIYIFNRGVRHIRLLSFSLFKKVLAGCGRGSAYRGLITLDWCWRDRSTATLLIFFYDNVWVLRDEHVSFGRLFLLFGWHFLGFCVTFSLSTRSLLALAALLGSYSASYHACVLAWLM